MDFETNSDMLLKKDTSSHIMFVPLVGYLFTCDHESSTRYCYYNGLEKKRKNTIYKQLTNNYRLTTNNNRRLQYQVLFNSCRFHLHLLESFFIRWNDKKILLIFKN